MDQKKIIRAALMTPGTHGWGETLLLEGAPGAGKSAIGSQIALSQGLVPFVLIGSQIEAPDVGGWPHAGERNGVKCLDFLAPYWVTEANRICETTDQGAVVVCDELNSCPGPVQAAMLRVINERVAGATALHPRIRFLAFMNPADIASEAGGNPIAPAMANRVGHMEWLPPTVADWTAHLMSTAAGEEVERDMNARSREASILAQWPGHFVKAGGEITAYLSANSGKANLIPATAELRRKAYPTYRSWENATRALAASRLHGLDHTETMAYVEAFIGPTVCAELFKYLKAKDIPDAQAWFDGHVTLDLKQTRADINTAVLRTAVALLTSSATRDLFIDRLVFLMKWYIKNNEAHSDLISGPLRQTFITWRERMKKEKEIAEILTKDKDYSKVVTEFRKIPLLARLVDLGILAKSTAG